MRRIFPLALLVPFATLSWSPDARAEGPGRRPNVVVILADDQGYGDLALHGNPKAQTPRIDALARQSAQFRQFHVAPICAPTRASFLTGRYFHETGVWGVHQGRDYIRLDETLLPEVFQANGYATAMFGKWHSGKPPAWSPHRRGFDEAWVAKLYKHHDNPMSHNGKLVQTEGWAVDRLTDLAIEFIQANRDRPFFLYFPSMSIHSPWEAPEDLVENYRRKGLSRSLATIYAMNEQLDTNVGKVLDELDRLRLTDDTIVVYFSDNGPTNTASNLPSPGTDEAASRNAANLRGSKGTIWENGTRVPMFVRWPGRIAPKMVEQTGHMIDLFPTLIDLAGLPEHRGKFPVAGRSLKPILQGDGPWPDRVLFLAPPTPDWPGKTAAEDFYNDKSVLLYERQRLVARDDRFKLVKTGQQAELFDIQADPGEHVDVSAQHPDVVEKLQVALREWYQPILASERSYGVPRFPIGARGEPTATVFANSPARVTGHVEGNSHFTTGWKSVGDSETLLVEVLKAGSYRVKLATTGATPGVSVSIAVGPVQVTRDLGPGDETDFGAIDLPEGSFDLTLSLQGVPSVPTNPATNPQKPDRGADEKAAGPRLMIKQMNSIVFTRSIQIPTPSRDPRHNRQGPR